METKEIRMGKRLENMIVAAVAVGIVLAVLLLPFGLTFAEGSDGKALFASKCAMCHGADGMAKEMWAKKGMKNMSDPAWQKENSDEAIMKAMTDGIPDKKMPAYKDKLSKDDTEALLKYIRTLAPAK
jgi:mono/diheme cytochrome c family protein